MFHPKRLDDADVLYLLVSEDDEPFYFVAEGDVRHPIVAMAICRYGDSGPFYLFKCDAAFEVLADLDVGSVEEAMEVVENSLGVPQGRWKKVVLHPDVVADVPPEARRVESL